MNAVKKLRHAMSMNQDDFAACFGITRPRVSLYENNKANPRAKVAYEMIKIAKKHNLIFTIADFIKNIK